MNVGNSVRKAIEDWEEGEQESPMLHACNAVDGTAATTFPQLKVGARFTKLLRDNYATLGPMGAPGVDLAATRFPVGIDRPSAEGGQPDLADIIYSIHRCHHGHGDALPDGFELVRDIAETPQMTRMLVEKGKVRLSERVIFGLLAVAVLAPVNKDQRVPDGYHLTFGGRTFFINEWWGRASEFAAIVAATPLPKVKLDFGDFMQGLE